MYIEDIISELNKNKFKIPMNAFKSYQLDMIESFSSQISKNIGFTSKQRTAAITLIKSNKKFLLETLGINVLPLIENPIFKMEIREKQEVRHVSIVPHSRFIRAIQLNVSYNPSLIEKIRSGNKSNIVWNPEIKAWQTALTESNILHIKSVTESHEFTYSDEFIALAEQCRIHYDNMQNIVPLLDLDDALRPVLRNVSEYVPPITTSNIIEALFESRKRGITTWSDSIKFYLDNSNTSIITRDFLEHEIGFNFEIDSTNTDIKCLTDFVKYLSPTVFIIPGGSEIEKLQMISEFINSMEIPADQVSVLFRLASSKNSNFNELVRSLQYNNPLTENTKIAIVSDKIRKPMIQSKIKFHSIINFGTISGAHITMRNFIRMNANLINYSEAANQRRLHFGVL